MNSASYGGTIESFGSPAFLRRKSRRERAFAPAKHWRVEFVDLLDRQRVTGCKGRGNNALPCVFRDASGELPATNCVRFVADGLGHLGNGIPESENVDGC
jgi:hypothetical protein